MAVKLAVLAVEQRGKALSVHPALQQTPRNVDRKIVPLPNVAHIGLEAKALVTARHAVCVQKRRCAPLQGVKAVKHPRVRDSGQRMVKVHLIAMAKIGGQQALGRKDAGIARHEEPRHLEIARNHCAVKRPRPASRNEVMAAQIQPALNSKLAHGLHKGGIGNADDTKGRRLDCDLQRCRDMFRQGLTRKALIQRHLAAQIVFGRQPAQHHSRICHRRAGSTHAVTGRPRNRPGRGRPHPQGPARIHPRDGPTTVRDGFNINRRQADWLAIHHPLAPDTRAPGLDRRQIRRGAAHIQSHGGLEPRPLQQRFGGNHPAREARGQQMPGVALRGLKGRDAPVGPHQQKPSPKPHALQRGLKPRDIARHDRADIGHRCRGRGSAPLFGAGVGFMRQENWQIRKSGLDAFGQCLFVAGVQERKAK